MPTTLSQQWHEMLRKSFEPRQWFEDQWFEDRDDKDGNTQQEERVMWVYLRTRNGKYEVGFYSPDKQWHKESDHATAKDAARKVHWLNGGGSGEAPASSN